ncbi:nitrilase-related carbon-nitrogen hydrolase [Rhodanobacter ginsengiterrae]|uniref:nitrilase-related carbon-nitrogen hydrolase n=1 Tax=Rhodanobacter ginsengiterrae TaxID=2008451 RepID=UPI003CF51711
MASRLDRFALTAWLSTIALSALMWWFGSGLRPWWWLTWLAPLPLLWLAPRTRAGWAALAAFLAWALGGMNQWTYLHGAIGLPLAVIAYVIAMPGVMLALCVLLFRRMLLVGQPLAAALAVPVVWVAVEYLNSLISPHGTFGNIGYTQMDALPVIQIAAVTGIWGIGFLVMLMPATLAVLTCPSSSRQTRPTVAVVAMLLIGASVLYGSWRMQAAATTTTRIGLVSLEKPVRPALDDAQGRALQVRYATAITRLADSGARIVVMPETAFATGGTSIPALAELAHQRGLLIDVGMDLKGAAERNMSMVLGPASVSPVTYSKHHLIPGFEDQYTPGDSYSMLAGNPRIGLAICKDMDFHDIGQAYAGHRAQLLLVPAWDFGVDGWLHSRMAILRGIESGFAVAHAARSGRLTLSDDRGRVVAEASSEQHDADLVGELSLRETRTLYSRWGDWFAWFDLATLAGLLGLARRRVIQIDLFPWEELSARQR